MLLFLTLVAFGCGFLNSLSLALILIKPGPGLLFYFYPLHTIILHCNIVFFGLTSSFFPLPLCLTYGPHSPALVLWWAFPSHSYSTLEQPPV